VKKKLGNNEGLTKKDLAQMLGSVESGLSSKIEGLGKSFDSKFDSKIDNLGKTLDIRITRMENYMKEGFSALDNKVEYLDTHLSYQIEGLGRRIDDLADNKVAKITYRELEHRVLALESKILTKSKK